MDQNPTPEIQVPTQGQVASSQIPIEPKFPMKLIGIGIVAILIISVGAFLLGRGSAGNTVIVTSTSFSPTTTTSPSATTSQPIPDKNDWLTYEFKGFQNTREGWIWKPFVIYYPTSWLVALENKDESSRSFNLTLKRTDGSYFTILQGFGEGGRCLFPQDLDYETFDGLGAQVTTYEEIQKSGDVWRLAKIKKPNDIATHVICGINPRRNTEFSTNWNVVGINEIKLTSDVAYREFLEIIKRIEIK